MSRFEQAMAEAREAREALLAERALQAEAPARIDPAERWAALSQRRIDVDALAAKRIVTPSDGPDAVPFDIMRTKLLATAREKGWKRVAITSPTPGCGKSTVSLNLAFSLARQPDLRTILCELDMRRPSLSTVLGMKEGGTFARVLTGHDRFAEHAVRYGQGLAIATCSRRVRNAAEILHAPTMDEALHRIEADYEPDLMLFDMPPLMAGDDTLAFAGKADAILIIAAAEVNSVAQIDACERELAEHCEIAGVILNKCHFPGEEYGYGTYYG